MTQLREEKKDFLLLFQHISLYVAVVQSRQQQKKGRFKKVQFSASKCWFIREKMMMMIMIIRIGWIKADWLTMTLSYNAEECLQNKCYFVIEWVEQMEWLIFSCFLLFIFCSEYLPMLMKSIGSMAVVAVHIFESHLWPYDMTWWHDVDEIGIGSVSCWLLLLWVLEIIGKDSTSWSSPTSYGSWVGLAELCLAISFGFGMTLLKVHSHECVLYQWECRCIN